MIGRQGLGHVKPIFQSLCPYKVNLFLDEKSPFQYTPLQMKCFKYQRVNQYFA